MENPYVNDINVIILELQEAISKLEEAKQMQYGNGFESVISGAEHNIEVALIQISNI